MTPRSRPVTVFLLKVLTVMAAEPFSLAVTLPLRSTAAIHIQADRQAEEVDPPLPVPEGVHFSLL